MSDAESLAPGAPRADVATLLAGLVTVTIWGSAFVAIRGALCGERVPAAWAP
jgi:hypothetical protein